MPNSTIDVPSLSLFLREGPTEIKVALAAMANRTPRRQFHLNNRDMKQSVILYPSAGTGHVIPMAELAKVFINHGFDVTMVIVPPFSGQFKRVAAATPSISFHVLPPDVPPPDDVAGSGSGKHRYSSC